MTTPILSKRLVALEAIRTASPARLSPEERDEAARRYEATLDGPEEPDPRAVAYWSSVSVHQIAADYDAMLKGAPAPWPAS